MSGITRALSWAGIARQARRILRTTEQRKRTDEMFRAALARDGQTIEETDTGWIVSTQHKYMEAPYASKR